MVNAVNKVKDYLMTRAKQGLATAKAKSVEKKGQVNLANAMTKKTLGDLKIPKMGAKYNLAEEGTYNKLRGDSGWNLPSIIKNKGIKKTPGSIQAAESYLTDQRKKVLSQ